MYRSLTYRHTHTAPDLVECNAGVNFLNFRSCTTIEGVVYWNSESDHKPERVACIGVAEFELPKYNGVQSSNGSCLCLYRLKRQHLIKLFNEQNVRSKATPSNTGVIDWELQSRKAQSKSR